MVSPLALTAGVGCYNNTAIRVNQEFVVNAAAYGNLSPIANLHVAITEALSNVSLGLASSTINAIQQIGSVTTGNYCPALGDSVSSNLTVPAGTIANLCISANAAGLTGNLVTIAPVYVGNVVTGNTIGSRNFAVFAQAFGAAQGYCSITNQIIESANRVNEYLGPTFTNLDDLITADLTRVTLALQAFGNDISNLGNAIALSNLENFGTPAALLQQMAAVGKALTPAVKNALLDQGLTLQDIKDLVTNNVESLFNPNGLTENQFDSLQKKAYPALCNITGTDLQDVLQILGVTTPNISSCCQLLDPCKIFPTSHTSFTLPTPNGDVLIYNNPCEVNSVVTAALNSGSITPRGCDQLSKIIPASVAAANRALQISFAQVNNIQSTTLPALARILT